MGPQGSGKGTQARMLAERYDLEIFETGAVLRSIAKQDTEIGGKINEIINIKSAIFNRIISFYNNTIILSKIFKFKLKRNVI